MLGEVKWFDTKKGFGFISKDDGQGDVFVHWRNVSTDAFDGVPCLQQGDQVSFDVATDMEKRKTYATNVRIVA